MYKFCGLWTWLFIALWTSCSSVFSGDNEVELAESKILQYMKRDLRDLGDYYVKNECTWGSTPNSATFYLSNCEYEEVYSKKKDIRWTRIVKGSESFDGNRPNGMQRNCEYEVAFSNGVAYGFIEKGDEKICYALPDGPSKRCNFLSPLELPFAYRQSLIDPTSKANFEKRICYAAELDSGLLVSRWSGKSGLGTGVLEVVLKDGLPVRYQLAVLRNSIGDSKPKIEDGNLISKVHTTWNVNTENISLPTEVKGVFSEAGETVEFHSKIKWLTGKEIPARSVEDLESVQKLIDATR